MVRDFGISGEKDVGFYVGFIASAFSLAQFMTSLLWGWVSDRVGRRPVLLIGLLGNAISLLLFGQAHSLQMAIFSRFLCGILNGNIGIAKCVIGEITDSTNQAFGFSLIGIMWSVGTILGPIMGGCLANPVQQFPWLFGGNEFLTRNPYFLPCGVSAVVSLIGFVIGFFFMEETNGKLARATAVGMRLATEEESPCGGSSREGSTSCLEIEDSVPQQDPCQTDSSIEPSAAKFGKAALMSIMAYALLAFQNIILDEVFSLWIVTGSEDGGLGYNSAEVGIVLSIIGALALYMQLITYPQLTRKYAPISLFRTGAVLYLVPYLSYPILSGYLNKTIENKTTIWILLICNLALRQFCNVITYTSIFILINNSASPGNLGLINGIAQTSAAFVRSIGPALGGIMWAWSINNGLGFPFNYWFVFLVVSAWGVGLILQSCFIPVVEGFEGGIGEAGFTGGSH
ncbi:major facilitator superfamily domain-containing protein [Obelidium mucronatum]|nr:major facilitator superfamily domain-containing protein [Obelidium mucronatum]